MTEKTTDISKSRKGDPEAWKCLDDEQRNTILDWYLSVREYDRKEQEKEESMKERAAHFGLVPFVFAYVLQNASTLFELVLNFLSALLVYNLVFYIFESMYIELVGREKDKLSRIIREIVAFIATFFVTAIVLQKCGII